MKGIKSIRRRATVFLRPASSQKAGLAASKLCQAGTQDLHNLEGLLVQLRWVIPLLLPLRDMRNELLVCKLADSGAPATVRVCIWKTASSCETQDLQYGEANP